MNLFDPAIFDARIFDTESRDPGIWAFSLDDIPGEFVSSPGSTSNWTFTPTPAPGAWN